MIHAATFASLVTLAMLIAAPVALAQQVDAETIVMALTPKAKSMRTRSILGPSRGIAIEGGDSTPEQPTSIDLHVPFEYDESGITMTDAQLVIDALAKALKDDRLAKIRFQIVGHTDARGTDEHNDALSARRANAVLKRLVDFHKIDPARLVASGRGRRELKDPTRPDHGINRRVQIRTLEVPSS